MGKMKISQASGKRRVAGCACWGGLD